MSVPKTIYIFEKSENMLLKRVTDYKEVEHGLSIIPAQPSRGNFRARPDRYLVMGEPGHEVYMGCGRKTLSSTKGEV